MSLTEKYSLQITQKENGWRCVCVLLGTHGVAKLCHDFGVFNTENTACNYVLYDFQSGRRKCEGFVVFLKSVITRQFSDEMFQLFKRKAVVEVKPKRTTVSAFIYDNKHVYYIRTF